MSNWPESLISTALNGDRKQNLLVGHVLRKQNLLVGHVLQKQNLLVGHVLRSHTLSISQKLNFLYFMFFILSSDFVSDFDLMLEKKKAEMSKRRKKKKDIDILNDNDDMISEMIRKMKEVAEVRSFMLKPKIVHVMEMKNERLS